MDDYKSVLLDILDIINYSEDKANFIASFINNIEIQSLQDMVQTLPADKQEEVKNKLSSADIDQIKANEVINSFFTKDQIELSLKNTAQNAITNLLREINDTLEDAQKEKLFQLFEKYNLQSSNPSVTL